MEKRNIDGIDIAYRIAGDAGGRPIVLIHGLTANYRDWFLNIKPLVEAGWRVLTPENPGHGDSSAPEDASAYEMARVADVLHTLAVAVGFAPAAIVGHSMGGAVAEEYAARHGADVAALVLVASAGGSPRPYLKRADADELAALERKVAFEQGIEAVWNMHQTMGLWGSVRELPAEAQAFLKARFCRCSPRGYIYGNEKMHGRRNTVEGLRRFMKPALVVCGEHEEALMKGTSAELAAALPNARAVTIANAGHSPQFENAEAFNAVLLDFLSSL